MLALLCCTSAWGEDTTATAGVQRPLNLSLPRAATDTPLAPFGQDGSAEAIDPVERNLRAAQVRGSATRLPYGSGYEARQRGAADGGDAAASGPPHNGSRSAGGRGGSMGGGRGRGR